MSRIDDLIVEYCPDGVEFHSISEIFDLKNGYTPSKSKLEYWTNGTVPWFRMEDIRANGHILFDSIQHVSQLGVKGGRLFPKDSVMIATSATIGEHALLKVDALTNQRFTVLSRKTQYVNRLLPEFVNYYCYVLDEWCKTNVHAGGFASVDMEGFKRYRFPIPPLPVQEEIVRILDSFSSLEAELEAELEARRKQYAYYRNELLTFERVVTVCIQDICIRICSGGTPSSKRHDYYDGNVPWLRTQDIDFNVINQTSATISDEGLRNSAAQWIPANCVIVAMYGATAAKVAVNSIPLTTNQACCNLQIDETKADVRYVFHWLSNEYEHLKALGEGSQSNINAKKVKSYPISLPPLEEQRRIVSILDRFDKLTNDLSSGLPAEIEARRKQYEYYRDRLLSFDELAV